MAAGGRKVVLSQGGHKSLGLSGRRWEPTGEEAAGSGSGQGGCRGLTGEVWAFVAAVEGGADWASAL